MYLLAVCCLLHVYFLVTGILIGRVGWWRRLNNSNNAEAHYPSKIIRLPRRLFSR